ncbi:MAG: ferrous iron transport protein A [Methanomassiliicoccaceae archaeon]|nr:ferrous iron transport protein A [Methanomassiliicoccaceae archaeon]
MGEICDRCNECNCICEKGGAGRVYLPISEGTPGPRTGMSLVAAKVGDCGRIVKIHGVQEMRKALHDLGFVLGAHVSITNENAGNLILEVKGSRIAMDRAMASKICFVPISNENGPAAPDTRPAGGRIKENK